jgi:hypothetical protein
MQEEIGIDDPFSKFKRNVSRCMNVVVLPSSKFIHHNTSTNTKGKPTTMDTLQLEAPGLFGKARWL